MDEKRFGGWVSWDDSSSVSSGISDTIDTDDINTSSSVSSYANTPAGSRRAIDRAPQTDAEKHSAAERGSAWSGDEVKRSDGGSDSGVRMEPGSRWRRNPSDVSDESDKSASGPPARPRRLPHGLLEAGRDGPAGRLRARAKGKRTTPRCVRRAVSRPSPPASSAPPRTRGGAAGTRPRSPQRARAPTSTFGFKKQPVAATTFSAGGTAIVAGGSATLGKVPRSAGRPARRAQGQHGRPGRRLPPPRHRPWQPAVPQPAAAQPSGGALLAAAGGNRSSTSSIESGLGGKPTALLPPPPKAREPAPGRAAAAASRTQPDRPREGRVLGRGGRRPGQGRGSAAVAAPQGGRQQGAKYPDVSSPSLRRLFGVKPGKQAPVTTAESTKNSTVISNPHATMGQQGAPDSPSGEPSHSPPASSPGSAYSAPSNSLTWGTTLSTSSALSKEGAAFPSVSSLHTSCESIDVSMSSGGPGCHGASRDDPTPPASASAFARTGSVRTGMSESPLSSPSASPKFARNTLPRKQDSDLRLDRNTLPKKGFRYAPCPTCAATRRPRSGSAPTRRGPAGFGQQLALLPGSSLTSPSSGTRFNFGQLGSPTTAAQINLASLRSNSLSNQDGCGGRAMSRSGSFRDGFEEVHGSSLSLVSSTSSVYSTPEEKSQSEIRKLRRELDSSQEKVSALTTQLSSNAHLVAAFEQSLGNMTIRLQSLTMTAEQKDSELNELRKTIEFLKKQNVAAQAAINGVINTPELTCKASGTGPQPQPDLRIRRQHSSDSVSSIASATSHSSVGSSLDQDAKNKKRRKNWLRSSFKQAFGKKKSPKSASSHSDIEEMTDSSLPSSPRLPHNGSTSSTPMLRNSQSNSLLSECADSEAETVMQLRSELREKEMKLTDIRLEALSSAHQLDQLREAMNRMQAEIEKLKAENDRLKSETQGSRSRPPSQVSLSPSPNPGITLSQHGLNLTESTSLDVLLDSSGEGTMHKDGRHVKIVVTLEEDLKRREECRPRHFLIGCIGVSGKTKWDVLDGVVRRLFKEYVIQVDPAAQLGLNSDSVVGYSIGDVHRSAGAQTPELLPCGYLVGENDTISVSLKGVSEHSQDSLVFETLIPKPVLQRYVSLLLEHRRLILSGPSGTGKSYLAARLAEHAVRREGRPLADGAIATFNVDHKSSKELRQYLSNLADQCSSESQAVDMPLVVILDNLHHVGSLGEIFNGLLNCKYHRCPCIIGTMNQATSSSPNLQLHHNFRWVLCANHTEPVKGFLGRFLRRKLMEAEIGGRARNAELAKVIEWIPRVWHHLNRFLEAHSSSDVTIGPRLFLSCPMDVDGSRVWFTDLWNYSIIPYMLEAVREGLQLYGRRAPWEDPARWVMDTYPWAASPQQHEWPPLLHLRPEDVGFDGYSAPARAPEQAGPQERPRGTRWSMNMLMRLQEAANCSSPQSYDSDSNSNSHQDDILDSSLESTLIRESPQHFEKLRNRALCHARSRCVRLAGRTARPRYCDRTPALAQTRPPARLTGTARDRPALSPGSRPLHTDVGSPERPAGDWPRSR
ncbi:hypothetical protein ANANG_G00210230 [Anguilla anguilla]|uniref:AAA+ ATPase domain-containing protein n=1 Tax=Anguilla anguilla TaxID=7936 RepID=A0A9D3M0X3_ANGAN|nr:hypothetical protein ANANG_G00210230 [Anguilla anguilla]